MLEISSWDLNNALKDTIEKHQDIFGYESDFSIKPGYRYPGLPKK
jgi:hypothetical protein